MGRLGKDISAGFGYYDYICNEQALYKKMRSVLQEYMKTRNMTKLSRACQNFIVEVNALPYLAEYKLNLHHWHEDAKELKADFLERVKEEEELNNGVVIDY